MRVQHQSKSVLPGRYESFCWEGVAMRPLPTRLLRPLRVIFPALSGRKSRKMTKASSSFEAIISDNNTVNHQAPTGSRIDHIVEEISKTELPDKGPAKNKIVSQSGCGLSRCPNSGFRQRYSSGLATEGGISKTRHLINSVGTSLRSRLPRTSRTGYLPCT